MPKCCFFAEGCHFFNHTLGTFGCFLYLGRLGSTYLGTESRLLSLPTKYNKFVGEYTFGLPPPRMPVTYEGFCWNGIILVVTGILDGGWFHNRVACLVLGQKMTNKFPSNGGDESHGRIRKKSPTKRTKVYISGQIPVTSNQPTPTSNPNSTNKKYPKLWGFRFRPSKHPPPILVQKFPQNRLALALC